MSWQDEVNELQRRRVWSKEMGGEENVERQHKGGGLTVRARIGGLVESVSFS